MIAALAVSILASTWSNPPSADVWVYPHASDPGSEQFMRVWGDGVLAIDKAEAMDGTFSYGFLQWKDLPKGKLKKATLTVYAVFNDALTEEIVKKAPLEAYSLKGTFDEKNFRFGGTEVMPTNTLFGKAVPEKDGDYWKLTIDLLSDPKSGFADAFAKAQESGTLGMTLGSSISPAESRSFLYKVATKELKEKQPKLTLELED